LNPLSFDKDVELHAQFVACASNLRSRNYGIPEMDNLAIKKIAGKIIPAIITSTSVASALASLELIKIISGFSERKDYLQYSIDLGMYASFSSSYPPHPTNFHLGGLTFSLWDRLEFTSGDFIQRIVEKFQSFELNLSGILLDKRILVYCEGDDTRRSIGEAISSMYAIPPEKRRIFLHATCLEYLDDLIPVVVTV